MARVIIPDVAPVVAAARRSQLGDVQHVRPELFDIGTVGKVLGTAEKIASSPLVIQGVDAIRRAAARAEMEGAQADIQDVVGDIEMSRRAAAARALAGQAPAAPVPAPGPVMAQQAQLSGLDAAQRAAATMVLNQGRRQGLNITPAVAETVRDAAASGQLLASSPSMEEYRAQQAAKAEGERRALQVQGEEIAGRQMTQALLDDRAAEAAKIEAAKIEAAKRAAEAAKIGAAQDGGESAAREAAAARAAKIARLSQMLADADTEAEIEAVQTALRNIDKAPQAAPAPAPQAHQPSEADRVNELRFNTMQVPPGPAQPRTPAVAPEFLDGREVYTPGAGQGMAATPEEARIEQEVLAAGSPPGSKLTPAQVRAMSTYKDLNAAKGLVGGATEAATHTTGGFVADKPALPYRVQPISGATVARPPDGQGSIFPQESFRLRPEFSSEGLEDKLSAADAESARLAAEQGAREDEAAQLRDDAAMLTQAVTLRTPAELVAAARNARTLEEQRLILSQIDNVELPSTNIFESLGLAPKDKTKLAFAQQLLKFFPKTAQSDPLTMARLARIELQNRLDREKENREKAYMEKRGERVEAAADKDKAGAESARKLGDLRAARKTEIENLTDAKKRELTTRARRNDRQGIAALQQARAAMLRAGHYGRSVDNQKDKATAEAERKAAEAARKRTEDAIKALKAEDAKLSRLGPDKEEDLPPKPTAGRYTEKTRGKPAHRDFKKDLDTWQKEKRVFERRQAIAKRLRELEDAHEKLPKPPKPDKPAEPTAEEAYK